MNRGTDKVSPIKPQRALKLRSTAIVPDIRASEVGGPAGQLAQSLIEGAAESPVAYSASSSRRTMTAALKPKGLAQRQKNEIQGRRRELEEFGSLQGSTILNHWYELQSHRPATCRRGGRSLRSHWRRKRSSVLPCLGLRRFSAKQAFLSAL